MKKLFIPILALITTICLFTTVVSGAESISYGDANRDGKVNIKDATHIQRCVAMITELEEGAFIYADVDANGIVNIKDATMIQKFLADIIDRFPAEDTAEPTISSISPEETTGTSEGTDPAESSSPTEETSTAATETDPVESTPENTTSTEPTPEQTDPTETTAPTEPTAQTPTKPSVDDDGYSNQIVRP